MQREENLQLVKENHCKHFWSKHCFLLVYSDETTKTICAFAVCYFTSRDRAKSRGCNNCCMSYKGLCFERGAIHARQITLYIFFVSITTYVSCACTKKKNIFI